MKMEREISFEASVTAYQSTRPNIQEFLVLQQLLLNFVSPDGTLIFKYFRISFLRQLIA